MKDGGRGRPFSRLLCPVSFVPHPCAPEPSISSPDAPGGLLRLARAIDRLNAAIGRAALWLSLLMVLVGAVNTLLRYLGPRLGTQLSSNAYLELQWYLFSLLFLLAGAWTLQRDRHVRVDVLYSRWSPRARAWVDAVGIVAFLIPFALVGLWVSWPAVRASWSVMEGSPDPGGLPRYPIKTVILAGFLLLLLQAVADLIHRVAFLRGSPDEPAEPHALPSHLL